MSLLVIPRRVSLRLVKVQRDFLWSGGVLEKKTHRVGLKDENIRNIADFLLKYLSPNLDALSKWSMPLDQISFCVT